MQGDRKALRPVCYVKQKIYAVLTNEICYSEGAGRPQSPATCQLCQTKIYAVLTNEICYSEGAGRPQSPATCMLRQTKIYAVLTNEICYSEGAGRPQSPANPSITPNNYLTLPTVLG